MVRPHASSAVQVAVNDYLRAQSAHPKAVCLITMAASNGGTVGMTIDSFVSISLDPPLVGFFVGRERSLLASLRDREEVAVNVLEASHADLARLMATSGEKKVPEQQLVVNAGGVNSIVGALAVFDGRVRERLHLGDHVLVVLDVHDATVTEGGGAPLLSYRSGLVPLDPTDRSTTEGVEQ